MRQRKESVHVTIDIRIMDAVTQILNHTPREKSKSEIMEELLSESPRLNEFASVKEYLREKKKL